MHQYLQSRTLSLSKKQKSFRGIQYTGYIYATTKAKKTKAQGIINSL